MCHSDQERAIEGLAKTSHNVLGIPIIEYKIQLKQRPLHSETAKIYLEGIRRGNLDSLSFCSLTKVDVLPDKMQKVTAFSIVGITEIVALKGIQNWSGGDKRVLFSFYKMF